MSFGEDRNKVKNIVRPQMERFRELYASFWPALSAYAEFNPSTGRCEQDTSPLARMFHLNLLPKKIQVRSVILAIVFARASGESLPTERTGSHVVYILIRPTKIEDREKL